MRRIAVVGNSGSGKTSLAAALAERLGIPHLELDSVFHQPGWQPLDRDEFRDRVRAAVAADSWVMDGNYRAVREIIWARADTIVWLDLPRRVVTRRIIGRTLRRVARRQELWNGNRERWRNLMTLNPQESVIVWSITKHGHYRRQFGEIFESGTHGRAAVVRLRSAAAVREFLQRYAEPPGRG